MPISPRGTSNDGERGVLARSPPLVAGLVPAVPSAAITTRRLGGLLDSAAQPGRPFGASLQRMQNKLTTFSINRSVWYYRVSRIFVFCPLMPVAQIHGEHVAQVQHEASLRNGDVGPAVWRPPAPLCLRAAVPVGCRT